MVSRGVRPRGNSIVLSFQYKDVQCRETIRKEPTKSNLRAVERLRREILDKVADGTFRYAEYFPDSPRRSLDGRGFIVNTGDYMLKWLESSKSTLATSTWVNFKKIVTGDLIPSFGDIPLADLKRRHIKEWASEQTASNKTIKNKLSVLRTVLHGAIEDELIDLNPLHSWTPKLGREAKIDHVDPLNPDEQRRILERLDGQARNLIQFAFWSGLRTSELVALRWGDWDDEAGVIYVRRAKTQKANEAEPTKTAAGQRAVKLLPMALEALRGQEEHTYLLRGEIFHNPRTNEPWTGDQAIRKTVWVPALERARVKYRNPYQTRHTYASMMLSAGESPMWVASQMGHKDWTMIARVYGKWIPDADPMAGLKANEMFGRNHGKLSESV